MLLYEGEKSCLLKSQTFGLPSERYEEYDLLAVYE